MVYTELRKNKTVTDQYMSLYESYADSRVLFLYGAISSFDYREMFPAPFSSTYLTDLIMALGARDTEKPIWLFIDSPGGSIDDGLVLIDAMNISPAPIYTVGKNCYSMGAVILSAGEPGHRYMMEHGRAMLHLPRGQMQGDSAEIEKQTAEMIKVKDTLIGLLQKNGVKKTTKEILSDIDRSFYMNTQESIDYGIIDALFTREVFTGVSG